jgi:1-deoxy-D-xylulose-5-phosphate reductoisomerase
MKKKIAILGSTGSIGKSTLDVISKDKKNFDVVLLSAKNNYKKLIQQAKRFKVKNIIIKNELFYEKAKKILKKTKIKVFSGNTPITSIISGKIDFTMSAIVGLAGLQPTVDAIKVSKTVALANKESIVCGWHILEKLKKKYNTKILPVDSEHFSIMELIQNTKDDEVAEIIITASGGPFLYTPLKKFKFIKASQAIKHPNWKMGKKISVDSANLMNKVFEVIEAYKLFKFNRKKYRIIIHPQSYVHSIIRFKNGLTKMILYNSDMKIPISNMLYNNNNKFINSKKIESKILNKMSFLEVDKKKYPSVKLIDKCLNLGTSCPIIINASNEILVDLFLKGKISFLDIVSTINMIFKHKEFNKYANRKAKSLKDIKIIDNWARLKTINMCVR